MRLSPTGMTAVLPAADFWLCFSAGQGGFGGQGGLGEQGGFAGGSNPYGDSGQAFGSPPPRKSSKLWLWLLLGLGGVGLAALVCCGAFGIWGVGAFNGLMTKAMQEELGGNPVIQQHIGQIQSVSMNISETQKEQKAGNDGAAVMDIRGDKGSGHLVILQQPGQQPSMNLRLPSGETFTVK